MNLEHFVKEVLLQLTSGIKAAQMAANPVDGPDKIKLSPTIISPDYGPSPHGIHKDFLITCGPPPDRPVQLIDFDIAISVSEGEGSKTGAGITVLSAYWGGQVQKDQKSSSISRTQFKIPIVFPSISL